MSEDQLQQKCVTYFVNEYQRLCKGFIFSVPNGGSRNPVEAKKLKATGQTAGVSDLIVILPNKVLFIELKTPTGIQSEVQKSFESRITVLGQEYHICRSLEEFQTLTTPLKIK